jgi:hypothetical protein
MCSCDRAGGQFCPTHLEKLREFVRVAEDFAGSDPMMDSHRETSNRFDGLLETAKGLLGLF